MRRLTLAVLAGLLAAFAFASQAFALAGGCSSCAAGAGF